MASFPMVYSYELWIAAIPSPKHMDTILKYVLATETFAAQGSAPHLRHIIDGRSMDLGATAEFASGLAPGSAVLVELLATGPVVSKKHS